MHGIWINSCTSETPQRSDYQIMCWEQGYTASATQRSAGPQFLLLCLAPRAAFEFTRFTCWYQQVCMEQNGGHKIKRQWEFHALLAITASTLAHKVASMNLAHGLHQAEPGNNYWDQRTSKYKLQYTHSFPVNRQSLNWLPNPTQDILGPCKSYSHTFISKFRLCLVSSP